MAEKLAICILLILPVLAFAAALCRGGKGDDDNWPDDMA